MHMTQRQCDVALLAEYPEDEAEPAKVVQAANTKQMTSSANDVKYRQTANDMMFREMR